ncbi:alpha/beta hydrolase [Alphaproteobacteria bacterium]|nr:alpha/beta hydrolase [Alphaproteobacteria bacterium]
MQKGYVKTDLGQIHYIQSGKSGPWIFLFHESPLSSWEFKLTIPFLSNNARVVAFDTPGYGQSDAPQEKIDIPGYAKYLCQAIEYFNPDYFIIGAVHTGSSIALELITKFFNERVTHAIFSGIPIIEKNKIELLKQKITKPVINSDGIFLLDLWNKRRNNWGKNTPSQIILEGLVQQLSNLNIFHWGFHAVFDYDAESALKKLSCPTLIINGDGDSLASIDKKAASMIPEISTLKIIKNVRGQIPYREPKLYAKEFLSFINTSIN